MWLCETVNYSDAQNVYKRLYIVYVAVFSSSEQINCYHEYMGDLISSVYSIVYYGYKSYWWNTTSSTKYNAFALVNLNNDCLYSSTWLVCMHNITLFVFGGNAPNGVA